MGARPVTLVGIATHDDGSTENLTFVGLASITGLEVGGGPILPTQPPGTPAHPIVIPPDPPAFTPGGVKPPPDGGGWGYVPNWGWGYFPQSGEGGKPKPPSGPGAPEMPPAVPS